LGVGYSVNISTQMCRDEYVFFDSIEKTCRVLDCKVDDIVEFIPVEENEEEYREYQCINRYF
jgi:putative transcriptional regulator